jgi:hypothetical protein
VSLSWSLKLLMTPVFSSFSMTTAVFLLFRLFSSSLDLARDSTRLAGGSKSQSPGTLTSGEKAAQE